MEICKIIKFCCSVLGHLVCPCAIVSYYHLQGIKLSVKIVSENIYMISDVRVDCNFGFTLNSVSMIQTFVKITICLCMFVGQLLLFEDMNRTQPVLKHLDLEDCSSILTGDIMVL